MTALATAQVPDEGITGVKYFSAGLGWSVISGNARLHQDFALGGLPLRRREGASRR
ncbi:hypothetical protein [Streptomyces sp. NPDC088762]|uniref:hypothetical protein n=1 Tax=Streptomyces sp. NPDC088762 TaxID=3365891 RepID=UPI00382016F7